MGRCIKDRDVYLEQDPSKAVPTTPFELWTDRKPSLRHLIFGVAQRKLVFNPHEKKLDSKIISGYFIGYPDKFKGYRFIVLTIVRKSLKPEMPDSNKMAKLVGAVKHEKLILRK